MKNRYLLPFTLITLAALTACQNTPEPQAKDAKLDATLTTTTPDTQGVKTALEVTANDPDDQNIHEESDTLIVDAIYPLTHNDTIDQNIKTFVEKSLADFKSTVADIAPAAGTKNSIYISYIKTRFRNQDGYVSYKFDISTYTGGAHPITAAVSKTFDLTAGKELTLADIFKEKSNYLKKLSDLSRADLKKQLAGGDLSTINDGTEPTEDNFRSWTFDNENLLLHFDPYQVAPYAAGPQIITIKLVDLSALVKDNFKLSSVSVTGA